MDTSLVPQVSSFETDTAAVFSRLRSSLAALTKALGVGFERPTDLRRILGIDAKLSWQVFNVIHEADPLAAVKFIPTAPSMNRLIEAAEKLGVSKDHGLAVRSALSDFSVVVRRHAKDREEFDFIASSAGGTSSAATAEMAFRRLAYRAESHIWGVCTDVFGDITIARLSEDRLTTDEISISVKLGFRRLRPDAPTTVVGYYNYGVVPMAERTRIPLDQAAADRYGAHLMPRFCSQPIPIMKTWKRPDGWMAIDVQSREIGHRSAISLTAGQIYRRCPLAKGLQGEPCYHTSMHIAVPTALFTSYMLIHRPSFGPIMPELKMFRYMAGYEDPAVAASAPRVLSPEEVRYVGIGKAAWSSPDIPRQEEMIQAAFDEVGWNPAEFDVYRVRIEYPPLHCVSRTQFQIPR